MTETDRIEVLTRLSYVRSTFQSINNIMYELENFYDVESGDLTDGMESIRGQINNLEKTIEGFQINLEAAEVKVADE